MSATATRKWGPPDGEAQRAGGQARGVAANLRRFLPHLLRRSRHPDHAATHDLLRLSIVILKENQRMLTDMTVVLQKCQGDMQKQTTIIASFSVFLANLKSAYAAGLADAENKGANDEQLATIRSLDTLINNNNDTLAALIANTAAAHEPLPGTSPSGPSNGTKSGEPVGSSVAPQPLGSTQPPADGPDAPAPQPGATDPAADPGQPTSGTSMPGPGSTTPASGPTIDPATGGPSTGETTGTGNPVGAGPVLEPAKSGEPVGSSVAPQPLGSTTAPSGPAVTNGSSEGPSPNGPVLEPAAGTSAGPASSTAAEPASGATSIPQTTINSDSKI